MEDNESSGFKATNNFEFLAPKISNYLCNLVKFVCSKPVPAFKLESLLVRILKTVKLNLWVLRSSLLRLQ